MTAYTPAACHLRCRLGFLQMEIERSQQEAQVQSTAVFHLVAQRDVQLSRQEANDMRRVALATHRDSKAMKTLAIVTMFYLPAATVASLFFDQWHLQLEYRRRRGRRQWTIYCHHPFQALLGCYDSIDSRQLPSLGQLDLPGRSQSLLGGKDRPCSRQYESVKRTEAGLARVERTLSSQRRA